MLGSSGKRFFHSCPKPGFRWTLHERCQEDSQATPEEFGDSDMFASTGRTTWPWPQVLQDVPSLLDFLRICFLEDADGSMYIDNPGHWSIDQLVHRGSDTADQAGQFHVRSVAGSVDILGGPDLDGSKRFKHYETYYVDEIEWTSISIILPILELTSYLLSTRRGYPQIVKGVFRRKSPDSTRRLGSSSCWRFYRWDSINQQKGIGWPYGDRIWRVFAVIWGSKAFLTVIMFVVTYLHVWSCLYF